MLWYIVVCNLACWYLSIHQHIAQRNIELSSSNIDLFKMLIKGLSRTVQSRSGVTWSGAELLQSRKELTTKVRNVRVTSVTLMGIKGNLISRQG